MYKFITPVKEWCKAVVDPQILKGGGATEKEAHIPQHSKNGNSSALPVPKTNAQQ